MIFRECRSLRPPDRARIYSRIETAGLRSRCSGYVPPRAPWSSTFWWPVLERGNQCYILSQAQDIQTSSMALLQRLTTQSPSRHQIQDELATGVRIWLGNVTKFYKLTRKLESRIETRGLLISGTKWLAGWAPYKLHPAIMDFPNPHSSDFRTKPNNESLNVQRCGDETKEMIYQIKCGIRIPKNVILSEAQKSNIRVRARANPDNRLETKAAYSCEMISALAITKGRRGWSSWMSTYSEGCWKR